jgi:hypothetical protein
LEVAVMTPYTFQVLTDKAGNYTYYWSFGDNSSVGITNISKITHTYASLGNYNLRVTVSNKYGNSSKSIQVKAGSPKNNINKTVNEKLAKITRIEANLSLTDAFVKAELEKKVNISDWRSIINSLKKRYDDCGKTNPCSDKEYTDIMSNLLSINIPDSLGISQRIGSYAAYPNEKQINFAALENFGAGTIKEGKEEEYTQASSAWFTENLVMTAESKTYALYTGENWQDLLTEMKITLTPKKESVSNIYLIINGNPQEIKVNNENLKSYENAAGIVIDELNSAKTIEIIYPTKITPGNFPVSISTEFSALPVKPDVEPCNSNKKCEKDLGETSKNCKNDCKPWGLILLIIGIVIFIGFVIYIILQEWYKRYYESSLFPQKNNLFNLINFMNTSQTQGIKKSEIFEKLKEHGWTGEQLRFAWNKLHGKRTGMWEIPLFKWAENKEVRKELEQRKKSLSRTPNQF